MRKQVTFWIAISLMAALLSGFSPSNYTLLLKSGNYQLQEGEIMQSLKGEDVNGYYYRIMQFYTIPTQAQKLQMENLGIVFFDYMPKNAYLVAIPAKVKAQKLAQFNIRSIADLSAQMKLTKNVKEGTIPAWSVNGKKLNLILGYYQNLPESKVANVLSSLGLDFEFNLDKGFVHVFTDQSQIEKIAANPIFYYVQEDEDPGSPENFLARTNHRVNTLQGNYAGGMDYDGTGVLVAHGDDGDIGEHIDFTGRLTSYAGPSNGDHGDHVAGTVFGAGNLNPRGRGMSPGAEIAYFSYFMNGNYYLDGVDTMYANMGVRITQSSYSNGSDTYTSLTRQMDRDIRDNRALMHVFSAGNAGSGWHTITGGHKQGKNVIAVANLTWDDNLAGSSSRGPAHDGRIKPDVGAVGSNVFSTEENNTYGFKTGTSMACPGTSGTLASLYQAYKDNNNQAEPDGGLMKAILMNSADDVGNAGPDYKQGYGRINARNAVSIIENHQTYSDSMTQGTVDTFNIPVGANVAELKVMVYWTDPEALVNTNRALVNDLNFTLYNASGTSSWLPWVLNPTSSSTYNNLAIRAVDSLNNAEQVTITNPSAGDYKVVVAGTSIPTGPQKYYVVYSFVENEIKVTHPIGGEHFNPSLNEVIRWDAPAGTGNFTIEYSTNNGSSWNTLSSNIPSTQRYYSWNVPNVVTGQALVRVSRGTKNSVSEAPFSIIGVPTGLNIVWACPDSMLFSWNAVTGATGYEVSMLGQKYMDSVGTSTSTQFMFTNTNPNTTYWISVKALAANGCVGERAVAIEKAPGTFGCAINTDAVLESIIEPSILPSCQSSSNINVVVEVKNSGQQNIFNIPLAYQLGTAGIVRDTLFDTLIPGSSMNFTFANSASLSGVGNYPLVVYSELIGDQNKYNDTLFDNVRVYSSQVKTLPYVESFDTFNSCGTNNDCEFTQCNLANGWENAINLVEDDFDFRTNSGSTPSNGTGPSGDHTSGNGKYIYIETSGTCNFKVGEVITPCFDLTGIGQPQANIWYHMLGTAMGELHVDALVDGVWELDIVTPVTGNQGNSWKNMNIYLSNYIGKTVNLRFRAISGSSYLSDIALDDFQILDSSSPPSADFSASTTVACLNSPVTFQDLSVPGASSWKWTITPATHTFVGGTSDTSQSPEVTFSALGSYDVKLKTTNQYGSDSITKVGYINVTNGDPLPVQEDFQGAFPPTAWEVVNPDGQTTWAKSQNVTGATGVSTNAAWMDNFNYNTSLEEDFLETPKVDLSGVTTAYLTFDVAYARYSATYSDGLRIEISTDCGATFTGTGYLKSGTTLATVPDLSSIFYPGTASHWRKDSVNLTSYINNSIIIRFVSISNYGNSLYIDNVNIIAGGVAVPIASFTVSQNNPCIGDSVTFTNTSTGVATAYNWNFGAGAVPPTASTVGPHTVYYNSSGAKTAMLTVSNTGGSNSANNPLTVRSEPVTNFSSVNNGVLSVSFTDLSTNSPTAWSWDFGDGSSSLAQNPTHTYAAGGVYNVTLTAENDCGDMDSTLSVYVSGIGLDEIDLDKGIRMMPNPASNVVSLKAAFAQAKELKIELRDVTGKLLVQESWNNAQSGNDFMLNISAYANGVYFIRVSEQNTSVNKRLIIRH